MRCDRSGRVMTEGRLPWLAAVAGMLMAVWMVYQNHGLINSDGIMYIEAARLFAEGEWHRGLALFNWPLYSLLIAMIHQVGGLGLQPSAHLLAILLFGVTCAGFVALVREAGGDRRVMLAACFLLLGSPYLVGKILPMLVRDHGFWACHVWSLVFFLRFLHHGTWKDAMGWGLAATMAVLFRIEGMTYLVMLPLALLAQRTALSSRLAGLLKAQTLLCVTVSALLLLLALHPTLGIEQLGRLHDPVAALQRVYQQFDQGLAVKARIYAGVLGPFLDDYASAGLLLTLGFIVLVKAAGAAGWLQLAFAIYAHRRDARASLPKDAPVFGWLVLLGLGNAIVIILSVFVLSKRYVLPIGIVILVYAAFGLVAMFDAWQRHGGLQLGRRWVFPASIMAIVLQMAAIAWPWNPGKGFELDAARWVRANIPASSRIYYDHGRMRYYTTGESFSREEIPWPKLQQFFRTREIRRYDYAIVHGAKKYPEREQFVTREMAGPPLVTFEDGRGSRVMIYRVPQ